MIPVNKKRRGRPPGADFPVSVQLRLTDEQARAVDAAREDATRSALIRAVLDEWLRAKGFLKAREK